MSQYGPQYVSQSPRRHLVAESQHHPGLLQPNLDPIPSEDAAADNDHHRNIAGNDFSVARIPIEMYRRRTTRPHPRWHQDIDTDIESNRARDTDTDSDRDPQYVRRTHLVELCFHSDFDPLPDTPSSLHFGNDNVVTHWRAPDLPEIPPLRPPNYLVEYDTLRLYPDGRQQYARAAAALVAANLALTTRRDWAYLSLLSVLFIALLLWPGPWGRGQIGQDDDGMPLSSEFSSLSLPYDIYDMVMLWSVIPIGLLGMRIEDSKNDAAAGGNNRIFPGPPGMDPIAFSNLPEAAQHYAIHTASSRQAPLDDLRALLEPACSLASWILAWIERHGQDMDKDLAPLLSYRSFRELGNAAQHHLNEAKRLWHRVELNAVNMQFHASTQIWWLLSDLKEQAEIIDSDEANEGDSYGFFFDANFSSSARTCSSDCEDHPYSREEQSHRPYTYGQWAELCRKWPVHSSSRTQGQRTNVPPPARVLRLLDVFHLALIRGRSDRDPRYGREEAAFLTQVCHPSPGSGGLLGHPACSQSTVVTSIPPAWESWARSNWEGVGGLLGYDGWQPHVFEKEPDILALARHLTAAGSLMDIVLDTIGRIPSSWMLEGGSAHESFKEDVESRRQARPGGKGDENNEENKDDDSPWSIKSLLRQFRQGYQKQPRGEVNDGARTMASLLNITASLSELRSTTLLGQETVVLEAVAGVLHVHGLWQDVGKDLEKLMADGGGEGWWSSHPGGGSIRRRIPSLRIMALIIGDLLERVEAVEHVTFEWWWKVSDATLMYHMKWFWDRVAEDERLARDHEATPLETEDDDDDEDADYFRDEA